MNKAEKRFYEEIATSKGSQLFYLEQSDSSTNIINPDFAEPGKYKVPDIIFVGYLPFYDLLKERTLIPHIYRNHKEYKTLLWLLCGTGNPSPLGKDSYLQPNKKWFIDTICRKKDYRFAIGLFDVAIEINEDLEIAISGKLFFKIGFTPMRVSKNGITHYLIGEETLSGFKIFINKESVSIVAVYPFRIGKSLDKIASLFGVPGAPYASIKIHLLISPKIMKAKIYTEHSAFPSIVSIFNWRDIQKTHDCEQLTGESITEFINAGDKLPSPINSTTSQILNLF